MGKRYQVYVDGDLKGSHAEEDGAMREAARAAKKANHVAVWDAHVHKGIASWQYGRKIK